jgi:hypothetical protein
MSGVGRVVRLLGGRGELVSEGIERCVDWPKIVGVDVETYHGVRELIASS